MALARGGRGGVDDLGQVDLGELERPRVAARERLQAVQELDEAGLLGQRVAEHLGTALGREVEMALQGGERGLDAGQRGAQLVAGVGGEAPRGRQRALAVGRRAPEAGEHRVEARRERAQLGRAAGRHAAVEILVLGHAGGHGAQPSQRAQHEVGRQPHPDPRGHQRDQPEREQAVLELRLAVLQRRQRADDLQAREAAETGVAQRGDVGAVALAARVEGLQPAPQARARGRRGAGVEHDAPAERQAQRACPTPRARRRGAGRDRAAPPGWSPAR